MQGGLRRVLRMRSVGFPEKCSPGSSEEPWDPTPRLNQLKGIMKRIDVKAHQALGPGTWCLLDPVHPLLKLLGVQW